MHGGSLARWRRTRAREAVGDWAAWRSCGGGTGEAPTPPAAVAPDTARGGAADSGVCRRLTPVRHRRGRTRRTTRALVRRCRWARKRRVGPWRRGLVGAGMGGPVGGLGHASPAGRCPRGRRRRPAAHGHRPGAGDRASPGGPVPPQAARGAGRARAAALGSKRTTLGNRNRRMWVSGRILLVELWEWRRSRINRAAHDLPAKWGGRPSFHLDSFVQRQSPPHLAGGRHTYVAKRGGGGGGGVGGVAPPGPAEPPDQGERHDAGPRQVPHPLGDPSGEGSGDP